MGGPEPDYEPAYADRLVLARGDLARLVLRLRSLSPPAWRSRRKVVVSGLDRLARLSGRAEGREVPPVPPVAVHALADAVAVIGGDAIEALAGAPDEQLLTELVAVLREVLELTR
ncbi:MAG TPA: hypothetical protein VME70_02625 [Mycobacteriales bacterium]|nr:hypothetical protein [Mycobacteriales bacterium]